MLALAGVLLLFSFFFFFFNATAPTEIYTLSLHDALPISLPPRRGRRASPGRTAAGPGSTRAHLLFPTSVRPPATLVQHNAEDSDILRLWRPQGQYV